MLRALAPAAALLVSFGMPSAAAAAHVPAGNWVWYYQHVQAADRAKFAGAREVVVSEQANDAVAIAQIHAKHALAFHYVNVYWYPGNRAYEGVDFSQNAGWAFCESGSQPAIGRSVNGVPWYYADLNERGLYDSVVSYLRSLRSSGYDGVFLDLGTTALAAGAMPGLVSTCTQQPVVVGATFADGYARVAKAAAAIGLHVVVNYTTRKPLRADVASVVDRTLYETAPGATAASFAASFARRRAEQAAGQGTAPRYVEEVKTSRLGDRAGAFFGWTQAALWRIDLTVNTGDDGCPGTTMPSACGRFGTFPELTAVHRGKAMDAAPSSRSCTSRAAMRCLWVRRWQYALVLVNTTAAPIRAIVSTGHRRCRTFTDIWRARTLNGGACRMKLTVTVPAGAGRVYAERYP
ncbi:MAG TPA: hypothetical protein VGI72_09580 [Gaiellales bacterium]|jgi:hypothetical protein